MKSSIVIFVFFVLALGLVLAPGAVLSEDRKLDKALYELDDFYYAAISGNPAMLDVLRDAVMCDRIGDTTFVGVFITTSPSDTAAARSTFEQMNLRTLVQIDNLFSAKVRLEQLPAIDDLDFVETIAPASPRGYHASRSDWQAFPADAGDHTASKKKTRN
ncbi:hypothetical protein KQH82_09995 [bacterium]|nr:hypothetical protein [bacterium]